MKKHPLSPAELQRGMRASIIDAVLAGPFYNLIQTSGVFFTGLALAVGANNFQIGLFAAVGPLLSGLSLLSARMLERGDGRKKHYIVTAAVQRGIFFVLLGFPFFAAQWGQASLAWLLLGLLVVATAFHYFQLTAWMTWMADMIPEDRRGSFFSKRNMIAGSCWMALSYATGLYLDTHKGLWDYALVFSVFSFSSLVALRYAAMQPDPPLVVAAKRPSLRTLWVAAYSDPVFKKFVYFHLAWGFTANLAAPFYNVYMLKNLELDMARVTLWTVLGSLLATVTTPWWGHVLDQAGSRATLFFAMVGTCVLGCLWPLLNTSNLGWLLAFILIAGGFFQSGVMQASFNMFLGILPEKNKSSYVALFQAVVGTLVGFSPVLGGWLAEGLKHGEGPSAMPFDSVMLVIVISAILRFIPLGIVYKMRDSRGRGIVYMMQEYVLVNPFRVMTGIAQDLFGGRPGKK